MTNLPVERRALPLALLTMAVALGGAIPALLAWHHRPRPGAPPMPAAWPPITILRPCEGATPGLAAALASSMTCPYPGPRDVLICTPTLQDPAAAIGAGVLAQHPATPGRLITDQPAHSGWTNPKVRHLQAGLLAAQGTVLVQADADVWLEGPMLQDLVARLQQPGTSAVFAPPTVRATSAWGSQVIRTYMTGSLHAFPLIMGLTRALGAPPALSGALVAYWRSALPEGYAEAAHVIGDDLVLGALLARHGQVAMAARPVCCEQQPLTLGAARRLLARWVYVAGIHGPARLLGYPLIFAASPLLLGLLGALARQPRTGLTRLAMAVGLAALLLRVGLAHAIQAQLHAERWTWRQPARLLLTEICLLEAALRAATRLLRRQPLRWRDRWYTLARGGTIQRVTPAPPGRPRA
jgi:ceramide glucosyltransferase